MKKSSRKKSISITRRIERPAAHIDHGTHVEIMDAPKLTYIPKDKETQNKLADELVAWCRLSDSLTINGFPISRGYNPYRFFRVALDNEYFADQLGLAKAIIIDRLEVGLHYGKYDKAVFHLRLPLYDRSYREMQLENIRLQREVDVSRRAENFRVEIAPAESSALVPPKDNNDS